MTEPLASASGGRRDPAAWALALEGSGEWSGRSVGGLPITLRLALSAQAGGAVAVISADQTLRSVLVDPRLAITVLAHAPSDLPLVRLPANAVVPPDYFCGDRRSSAPWLVTDSESASAAEIRLFEALGKSNDGWLARALNRRLSRRLSRWLSHSSVTPNQLSLLTLAIGLCSAAVAAQGSYGAEVAGASLLQLQSVLDGCDGELARATFRTSFAGEWLDTIADNLTNYAFIGCASWGLYLRGCPPWYPVGGLVALVVSCTLSAVLYRDMIKLGTGDVLRHPLLGHARDSRFVRGIRPLFKRDTFLFALFCAASLDMLGPALIAFAIGGIVLFGQLIRVKRAGAVESVLQRAQGLRPSSVAGTHSTSG